MGLARIAAFSLLILAFGVLSEAETDLAAFFIRCSRDDPNVNICLDKAIQHAIRSLKDGYEVLGLIKLDPLLMEKVSLKDSQGATLDLLNYDVDGLKDVICENTSFTFSGNKKFRMSFDIFLPQFNAAGSYKMERLFLESPQTNEGRFTFNLTGYRVNFTLDGVITTRGDGKEYATFSGVSSSFNGGTNPRVHFSNNSEKLNQLWNREPEALLQSYKVAIDQVHPVLSAAYSNLLFSKVALDELFPVSKPTK